MSCGIDSLYTVSSLTKDYIDDEYKVNCLTFIDAGASHYIPHISPESSIEEINQEANKIHENKIKKSREVAKELNMPHLEIRSNISDLYQGVFGPAHVYRNISAVLCLQKYFKKYYYSSAGSKIDEFIPDIKLQAHIEQLAIPCLSVETLELICGGISITRFEKTKELTDYVVAQKHLNVCNLDENCGKCSKCFRTLLMLEIFDKLDNFSKVFNLEEYKKNRNRAYLWLVMNKNSTHDQYAAEIYKEANKKKLIPFVIKIEGFIGRILIKIFK